MRKNGQASSWWCLTAMDQCQCWVASSSFYVSRLMQCVAMLKLDSASKCHCSFCRHRWTLQRCSSCMCLYLWDLSTICTKCCWRLLTLQTASNSFKQLETASNSFQLRTLLRSSFIYHHHRGHVGLVRADSAKLKTGWISRHRDNSNTQYFTIHFDCRAKNVWGSALKWNYWRVWYWL